VNISESLHLSNKVIDSAECSEVLPCGRETERFFFMTGLQRPVAASTAAPNHHFMFMEIGTARERSLSLRGIF
jgi:hypothetical protein